MRVLEADKLNAPAEVDPVAALVREGKRWTNTILGYDVQGRDQRIGDVQDLLVDDQTGDIRYLVVNAYDELSSRTVLLAPSWTHRISWGERAIYMDFSQQVILDSPVRDQGTPVTREYETRLHLYYGRPPYWATRGTPEETDDLGHRSKEDSPEMSSVGSSA